MTATHRSIAIVLIVVVALATAPAAGAALVGGVTSGDESSTGETTSTADSTDASMGAELSAFMQASATDADESIDAELFIAAFEKGDNETREAIVSERTAHLEQRLERLEADYQDLLERKDEMNPVAYNARMTRLTVQIESLNRSIDDVEPRARDVGVDTEALERLRTEASELSGPEVAAIARNLSGVEPPRGPPEHANGGLERDGGEGVENDTGTDLNADTNRGAGGGPPAESGAGNANASVDGQERDGQPGGGQGQGSNADGTTVETPEQKEKVKEKVKTDRGKANGNAATGADEESDDGTASEPETIE